MEDFTACFSCLVAALLAVVLFALAATFGYVVMQPIMDAARKVHCPCRFLLSDMLWLMLLLQFPLGFVSLAMRRDDSGAVAVIGVLLLLMCVVVWLRGVSTLSGLEIFDGRRRGVFLVVVLPMAILGSIATLATTAIAVGSVVPTHGISLLAILPIVPVCYGLRLLTFWVLSGVPDTLSSTPEETPNDQNRS